MSALQIFLVALGVIVLLIIWESSKGNTRIGFSISIGRREEKALKEKDDEQKPGTPMLKP